MAEKGRSNIELLILDALKDSDKYGYAIAAAIKSSTNTKNEIKQPTLYAYLKKLESKELIASYWGEESNGGRRRYYKLTEKGINELSLNKNKIVFDIDEQEEIQPAEFKTDKPEPVNQTPVATVSQKKKAVVTDDELDLIAQRLKELESYSKEQENDENVFDHIEFENPDITPADDTIFTEVSDTSSAFSENETQYRSENKENQKFRDEVKREEKKDEPEHSPFDPFKEEREDGIMYMEDFLNETERSIDLRYQSPSEVKKKAPPVREQVSEDQPKSTYTFQAPELTEEENNRISFMFGNAPSSGSTAKKAVKQDKPEKNDAVIINTPITPEMDRRTDVLFGASKPKEKTPVQKDKPAPEKPEKNYKSILRDMLGEQINATPSDDDKVVFTEFTEQNDIIKKYAGVHLDELKKEYAENEGITVKLYNNDILNYKPVKVLYSNKINMVASLFSTLIVFAELLLLYLIGISNVNEYNPSALVYTALAACIAPVAFGMILLTAPNKKSYRFAKPTFSTVICCIIAAVIILFVLVVNALLLRTDFGKIDDLINNVLCISALATGIPIWSLIKTLLFKNKNFIK